MTNKTGPGSGSQEITSLLVPWLLLVGNDPPSDEFSRALTLIGQWERMS